MPQLRSFNSYAPAPQLAQAYTAGTGLAQRDEELLQKTQSEQAQRATQYAIAEMETATRRQALAQEAVQRAQALDAQKAQFDMNLQAQKEQLKQESMMKEQELEVDKFYKTGMLGVDQRKATTEEAKLKMQAEEASRKYTAQDELRRSVEGVPENERAQAYRNSLLLYGPQAGIRSGDIMGVDENRTYHVGNNLVQLDPQTGEPVIRYSAPQADPLQNKRIQSDVRDIESEKADIRRQLAALKGSDQETLDERNMLQNRLLTLERQRRKLFSTDDTSRVELPPGIGNTNAPTIRIKSIRLKE